MSMDSDIGKNTDRLSKLPDTILCHILSLLPTKNAVGTSVLSTRWRYLWTFVTTLHFDDTDDLSREICDMSPDEEAEFVLNFMNFVNRVLLLSEAARLEKFVLYIGLLENFHLVNTWLETAIKRYVKELSVDYNMGDEYYVENPVLLPDLVFNSKTLVRLTLSGNIILKVPGSVWLPSLKILNLDDIKYTSEDSVDKLFAGCSLLEDLYIDRVYAPIPLVFNIKVPTLKRLTVSRYKDDYFDQDYNGELYKLVVDAPKLEYLHLEDRVTEEYSFGNLSALLKAYIIIGASRLRPSGSTNPDERIYKQFTGVENVKSLEFVPQVEHYLLPTFNNLSHLRLGSGSSSWNLNLLTNFLEHSANLEDLVLQGYPDLGSAKSLSLPQEVPRCLLLYLEKVKIMNFEGTFYELEIIEYLMRNARVLKVMTIHCRDSGNCFRSDVAGYTRGSKNCKLKFLT